MPPSVPHTQQFLVGIMGRGRESAAAEKRLLERRSVRVKAVGMVGHNDITHGESSRNVASDGRS
jgi:hypothetical protein